ncbi:MAG: 50S ribosomal protein L3 [Planctomycetaceae bacterium]|jgi:large subunit ribosomal protein L3|nr:50S ribosomal protein L3 [Planctomycetaceae bacterium]
MSIGLLGQKIGCTQLYTETGEVIPVTVVKLGPCHVLQIRSNDRDGYEAVQLGYGDKSRNRAAKCERGHVAQIESKRRKTRSNAGIVLLPKAGCEPKKFVREFRIPTDGYNVGQEIKVDVFDSVLSVDVTAISKGSGYTGVMKRHNFGGQRASHGVKKCHRHLGSSGCSAFPSRTQKGKRMAGQYGTDKVTVRNQNVVLVDKKNDLLVIRGAVPGPKGGYVTVKPANYKPAPKTNHWKMTKENAAVNTIDATENVEEKS